MAIVTRLGKGAPLTAAELDNNFIELSIAAGLSVGGPGTVDGSGLDTTYSITSAPRVINVTGVSRPIAIDITCGAGDSILMATTTDPAGLTDSDHESWEIVRPSSGASVIEIVGSPQVVGIQLLRTAGTSSGSSVRVYAPERGPGYNPVYSPTYDASPQGLNDTRRFLDQATMGPRPLEAAAFTGSYGQWINNQLSASPATLRPLVDGELSNLSDNFATVERLWMAWSENDTNQLRLRTAHALTQIIPVNSRSGQWNLSLWHDGMVAKSLGNYRQVLDHACMHRAMGGFLNNLGNNAKNGVPPSQNFARELIQLFSLGIHVLNKDGSLVLVDGQPVKAYQQSDVGAAARYLAGWGVPFASNPGGGSVFAGEGISPANGDMMTTAEMNRNDLAYDGPPLTLFGFTQVDYPAFAQAANPTNAQIRARKDAVIDILMRQPSIGPYICKQLIQKMVTDSPSPQYVRRVVAAWDNNGSGVNGDLAAVVRAILLDEEARGNSKPATFGRAQEWILSCTKRQRYAQSRARTEIQQQYLWYNNLAGNPSAVLVNMAQQPGRPQSVFNDFPFRFMLNGVDAPAAALWTAPAVQANIGMALSFSNTDRLASQAPYGGWDATGRWQATALIGVYDAAFAAAPGDAAAKRLAAHNALIDKVYPDMHQGAMPSVPERAEILGALNDWHAQGTNTQSLCIWLTNFVMVLPRAAVVL